MAAIPAFGAVLALSGVAMSSTATETITAQPIASFNASQLHFNHRVAADQKHEVVTITAPDGTVLGGAAGFKGMKVEVGSVVVAPDGKEVLSNVKVTPGPKPSGATKEDLDPLTQLRALGAPAQILKSFGDSYGGNPTGPPPAIPARATVTDAKTGVAHAVALADSTTGLKLYNTVCSSSNHGSGVFFGCTRRFDFPNETDPDSFYKFDEGKSSGYGSAGDDLVRGIIEHEYAGYMHIVDWEPYATYNPSKCDTFTFSLSAQGAGGSYSFPLCPDKVYPGFGVGYFRATWEGRSSSQSDVRGTLAVNIARGDCFCGDGFATNIYAAYA